MNRLKAVRRRAGVNQYQLAEQLGKGQSYVSKYERCERRLDVIEFLDIANVLGVDPVDLIKDLPKPSRRSV
jgi:transcriptional regulator with XRE-family HTH domain